MKKVLSAAILILFSVCCFALAGCSSSGDYSEDYYDSNVENFVFELQEDGTYSVITYSGENECVEVPGEYNEKQVTTISSEFKSLGFKKVKVSEGITTLEDYSFHYCRNLQELYLPSTIENIGQSFLTSVSMQIIEIDDNNPNYHTKNNCLIKTEEKALVKGCKTSIIPSDGSVTQLLEGCFVGMGIESIVIPASIVYIENFSFAGDDPQSAYFENVENWYYCGDYDGEIFSFISENLSNPTLAALYLRKNYYAYDWRVITD